MTKIITLDRVLEKMEEGTLVPISDLKFMLEIYGVQLDHVMRFTYKGSDYFVEKVSVGLGALTTAKRIVTLTDFWKDKEYIDFLKELRLEDIDRRYGGKR